MSDQKVKRDETASAQESAAGVQRVDGLRPCPFCGGGETLVHETRSPGVYMDGRPRALISVEIRHFCDRGPGSLTRQNVLMAGRDHESAIAAWNRRAINPQREEQ